MATRSAISARACSRRSPTWTGALAQGVIGLEGADQGAVDRRMIELDGTDNKGRLGANALLAISLAVAQAAAAEQKQTLFRHVARSWRRAARQ